MPLQQRIVVAGFSAAQAAGQVGTVQNGLTSAGTTQANALPLPADVNRFTTVGAGSGTILPAMNPGDEVEIINGQVTNALLVYPPVGGQINQLGVNAGYSVAVATPSCFVQCITPLIYAAQQSA